MRKCVGSPDAGAINLHPYKAGALRCYGVGDAAIGVIGAIGWRWMREIVLRELAVWVHVS
jgi:hypothetical protein